MTRTPTSSSYAAWYAAKGAERNARRREAYAKDAKLRKENQKRSREWRRERAKGVAVSREVYREVAGERVRVWSLGQLADMTGYSVSALRGMVADGTLPEPSLPGIHRYYLGHEVKVIKNILKKRR